MDGMAFNARCGHAVYINKILIAQQSSKTYYEGENLKRILSVSPAILCILYGFLPFFKITGAIFGYDFVLLSYSIYIIALAVISIITIVLLFLLKTSMTKTQAVFSALIAPLSVINGLCFVFVSSWELIAVFALVCCGCAIIMLVKFARPLILKIIILIISILLILAFIYLAFVDYVFQDFSLDIVEKSIQSPQKTYIAEVISSDPGAMGGDTFVNVRYSNNISFDLLFCKFTKKPVRVYAGRWGEFENMQIAWEDEHTLIINGRKYSISY